MESLSIISFSVVVRNRLILVYERGKEMTILQNVMNLLLESAYSGVIWDLTKGCGKNLIKAFSQKFIQNESFKNPDEVTDFWRFISQKEANSRKNPYADVKIIYEDIVDVPKENFIQEFEIWLKENIEELKKMQSENAQSASIYISTQTNSGSGKIVNAGIINNY